MTNQSQIDSQVKGLRFLGGKWAALSDDALTAHVVAWFAAFDETGIVLPMSPTFGLSAEEMLAKAQTLAAEKAAVKASLNKKRAGVKALQAKYGHESAARIVSKYAGRAIYR
jgi:hypothetical protein